MRRKGQLHEEGIAEKVYNLHVKENLTYTQIAERFGDPWTRGSVAGLVSRYRDKILRRK